MKKEWFLAKKHYTIAFFATLAVSVGLIISGFLLPPKGQVDPSVLTACGELFLWPALALGAKSLEEGRNARIKRGNTTIELGDVKSAEELEDEMNEEEDYGRC